MPVFDYRCTDCGSTYDVLHKVREVVDDVVCPSCGSTNHKRLISAPNVAVQGFSKSPDCRSSNGGGCAGGMCGLN